MMAIRIALAIPGKVSLYTNPDKPWLFLTALA
jgi:hypothetical protein